MSFWDLSDGETAKTENKEFEVPGGNFDPIPDNSDVLSEIKSVKWNSPRDKDERFVEINWRILAPEQFKNREVFQKKKQSPSGTRRGKCWRPLMRTQRAS
jgi:hypothetical protein